MAHIEAQTTQLRTGDMVTIRTAAPGDAGALNRLKWAIAQEWHWMMREPDEFSQREADEATEIERLAGQPAALYLVATRGEKVIGFGTLENGSLRRTAHSATVTLYLGDEWRAQGIGRLLLETLLAWARAHPQIEKVTLAVFDTNARAIALYQRCGFIVEGHCPYDMKFGPDQYVGSLLMYQLVKPLPPMQGTAQVP